MACAEAALTTSDTPSYVDFAPFRTGAYPAFLDLVGVGSAVLVQCLLFGIAAACLAVALGRLVGSWWAGAALLALFVNPELNQLHWSLLTESLFVTLVIAAAAAWLSYLPDRRPVGMIMLSAFLLGIAAAVRPSAMPLVALPIAALLLAPPAGLRWGKILALALGALLAWALPVVLERAYARQVHAEALTSLAPRHLFAKAALIEAPPIDRSDLSAVERRLADAIEKDFRPVRNLLERSKDSIAHQSLLQDYEVCIQWVCGKALGIDTGNAALQDPMRKVALRRLTGSPLGWVELMFYEYRGLWFLGARTHPSFAPGYDGFIAANRPLPFEQYIAPSALEQTQPRRMALIATPVYLALGAAMLVLLAWSALQLLRRRTAGAIAVFLATAGVQLNFLFTSAAGIGYGRYTVAMWPLMILALTVSAALVVSWLAPRRGARAAA